MTLEQFVSKMAPLLDMEKVFFSLSLPTCMHFQIRSQLYLYVYHIDFVLKSDVRFFI